MKYQITQWKLEVLMQYLTSNSINLTPAFQRGRVWKPKDRQSLLKNIVAGKPIPAVFLYKEAIGSQYSYNILDGKQRIESILLFIGDQRPDFHVPSWKSYFFSAADKSQAHFKIDVDGGKKSLKELSDGELRNLRDYTLSIIEIDFEEATSLDEIISLFVDINQSGIHVNRFDIIKALYRNDPLLQQVFKLIAQKQKRRDDVYFKSVNNNISLVLQNLETVKSIPSLTSRLDKMWERLFEGALFCRSGQHRKPSEILKEFIRSKKTDTSKLTPSELARIQRVFKFIAVGYRKSGLGQTRWATDQTHFYILLTALLSLTKTVPVFDSGWYAKLVEFDKFLTGIATAPKTVRADVKHYIELSAKQTTDPAKRKDREELFVTILEALP